MAYVYRYTDRADNIVKYIGIVWGENRTLKDRIREHDKEEWCNLRIWKIDYLKIDDLSRTDAEYIEAHLISVYKTYEYFNKAKGNWGKSIYINHDAFEWIEYNRKSSYETIRELRTELKNKNKIIKQLTYDIKNPDYSVFEILDEERKKEIYELKKEIQKYKDESNNYYQLWNELLQEKLHGKDISIHISKPKRGRPQIDYATNLKAIEMHNNGMSYRQISKELGISLGVISKMLNATNDE